MDLIEGPIEGFGRTQWLCFWEADPLVSWQYTVGQVQSSTLPRAGIWGLMANPGSHNTLYGRLVGCYRTLLNFLKKKTERRTLWLCPVLLYPKRMYSAPDDDNGGNPFVLRNFQSNVLEDTCPPKLRIWSKLFAHFDFAFSRSKLSGIQKFTIDLCSSFFVSKEEGNSGDDPVTPAT